DITSGLATSQTSGTDGLAVPTQRTEASVRLTALDTNDQSSSKRLSGTMCTVHRTRRGSRGSFSWHRLDAGTGLGTATSPSTPESETNWGRTNRRARTIAPRSAQVSAATQSGARAHAAELRRNQAEPRRIRDASATHRRPVRNSRKALWDKSLQLSVTHA